jgi:hypothetical protein
VYQAAVCRGSRAGAYTIILTSILMEAGIVTAKSQKSKKERKKRGFSSKTFFDLFDLAVHFSS